MSNELELQNHDVRQGHMTNSLFSESNLGHYMKVAETLAKSTMVPKALIGKPADILICMDMGIQLGIPFMQALQDIAVINGKPSLYGDGLLAVVQGHKDYEWIEETSTHAEASCTIKRRNHEPHTVIFTAEDARKAKLWGKPGPWTDYPKRMLQMRARGFAIRDVFSDALRGVKTAEEVIDYAIEGEIVKPKSKASSELKSLLSRKNETKVLSSHEQHESIANLIHEKSFNPERYKKAMAHFKVSSHEEMSFEQANKFIEILNKEPGGGAKED